MRLLFGLGAAAWAGDARRFCHRRTNPGRHSRMGVPYKLQQPEPIEYGSASRMGLSAIPRFAPRRAAGTIARAGGPGRERICALAAQPPPASAAGAAGTRFPCAAGTGAFLLRTQPQAQPSPPAEPVRRAAAPRRGGRLFPAGAAFLLPSPRPRRFGSGGTLDLDIPSCARCGRAPQRKEAGRPARERPASLHKRCGQLTGTSSRCPAAR